MKKSLLLGLGLVLATAGLTTFSSADVSAHGYVESPISRGYQVRIDSRSNWGIAREKYGAVIDEPQSLEARKGFPEAGPADGKIASANEAKGPQLDAQTSTLWTKQNITTGPTNFTWHYTKSHRTTKWHYYITKNGWDQNKKLTRDELQFIGEVQGYGQTADKMPLTQTINIPSDHIGYHVILAVWDIYDTSNAFYNVIDVNIQPRTALTDLATH